MTPEQNKAIRDFASMVSGFADISRFHLKRTLGNQEWEAKGEIDGYYQDLIDARDALMRAFQDEPKGAFNYDCSYCNNVVNAVSQHKLHELMYYHLSQYHSDEEDVHGKLEGLHDALKEYGNPA